MGLLLLEESQRAVVQGPLSAWFELPLEERCLMVTKDLSDQLFERFSRLVYQECGINLHSGKKELLQARLNKRLRATGLTSYREYYDYITSLTTMVRSFIFLIAFPPISPIFSVSPNTLSFSTASPCPS